MIKKNKFTFFNEEWNEEPFSKKDTNKNSDKFQKFLDEKYVEEENEKSKLFSRIDIIGQNGNNGEHYKEGN